MNNCDVWGRTLFLPWAWLEWECYLLLLLTLLGKCLYLCFLFFKEPFCFPKKEKKDRCWILSNTALHFWRQDVCEQVRVSRGEFSLLKWGIISLWFSNIKLSFYLWNPSCFFVIMKNTIFPQETALILYICVMLRLLIGIFRILFWKRGLIPLDLFY